MHAPCLTRAARDLDDGTAWSCARRCAGARPPAPPWPLAGGRRPGYTVAVRDEPNDLAAQNQELRRAIFVLDRVSDLLYESLELVPTLYALLTGVTAADGLGLNRAMIFQLDGHDHSRLRGVAAVGPANAQETRRVWRLVESTAPGLAALYEAGLRERDSPGSLDERVRQVRLPADGDTPVALAHARGELVHGEGADDAGGLFHLPTSIAAPLRGATGSQGVLYADSWLAPREIGEITRVVFAMVADHAGRALEHARHYEDVAARARTDALTGLGHHGAMREALRVALLAARRAEASLGLAMIDLDDFKEVNDVHGHLAGDALLAGVASTLRAEVRAGETPFRYGGEEFAVVLPSVRSPDELAALGERIRAAVERRRFSLRDGKVLGITCSVGLAALRPAGRDGEADALIDQADRALLRAKAEGKNRCVMGEMG